MVQAKRAAATSDPTDVVEEGCEGDEIDDTEDELDIEVSEIPQ